MDLNRSFLWVRTSDLCPRSYIYHCRKWLISLFKIIVFHAFMVMDELGPVALIVWSRKLSISQGSQLFRTQHLPGPSSKWYPEPKIAFLIVLVLKRGAGEGNEYCLSLAQSWQCLSVYNPRCSVTEPTGFCLSAKQSPWFSSGGGGGGS